MNRYCALTICLINVNFKKKNYDNHANITTRSEDISSRPVEIKQTGNLIAIDPGVTSILEGIEEKGKDNYKRITKSCNDYYSERLINSANIHRDLELDKEEYVHIKDIFKKMPTLKTINSTELATNIGYNFFFNFNLFIFVVYVFFNSFKSNKSKFGTSIEVLERFFRS